jgi:enamine deaminase RidA (YjgF/YER057c/UK114 family)
MSGEITMYNPPALEAPLGMYNHIARVKVSEFVFIAGMLSADAEGPTVGEGDFDVQAARVFANLNTALVSAELGWSNVVSFTTYLVHSQLSPKYPLRTKWTRREERAPGNAIHGRRR